MNREKADIVLNAIKADEARHDQTRWTNITATPGYEYGDGTIVPDYGEPKVKETEGQVINCGTTACFAGHTAFIFAPVGTKFYKDNMRIPEKPLITYDDFADQELELTQGEVNYLFAGHRDLDELVEYVEATIEERAYILNGDSYNE